MSLSSFNLSLTRQHSTYTTYDDKKKMADRADTCTSSVASNDSPFPHRATLSQGERGDAFRQAEIYNSPPPLHCPARPGCTSGDRHVHTSNPGGAPRPPAIPSVESLYPCYPLAAGWSGARGFLTAPNRARTRAMLHGAAFLFFRQLPNTEQKYR